jgi:hypothetical protein
VQSVETQLYPLGVAGISIFSNWTGNVCKNFAADAQAIGLIAFWGEGSYNAVQNGWTERRRMKVHGAAMRIFAICMAATICLASGRVSHIGANRAQIHSSSADALEVPAAYGQLPLAFEPNTGQFAPDVQFLARGKGFRVYLSADGAIIEQNGRQAGAAREGNGTFSIRLAGSNPRARIHGEQELAGQVNYLLGNDPGKWRQGIPTYAKIKYEQVYPGIDLIYYGNPQQLEYDFIIAPRRNAVTIHFQISGAAKSEIARSGELVVTAAGGREIRLERPKAYQEFDGSRHAVEAQYVLGSGTTGFQLGAYNKQWPLIIDPTLVYSTYLGGNGDDYAGSIAVDAAGHAYVAGVTASPDFPATPGVFQATAGGGQDAFVAKFSADGKSLLYCTYLGGNADDAAFSLAIDAAGHAYIAGITGSTNFPTTAGAFQTAPGGGPDGFVAKLSADGKSLVYSTYLGGNGWDQIYGIAVDPTGNAYVAGFTASANFPMTAGAFQATYSAGASDAFVAKLSGDGKSLVYSTYVGGNGDDAAYAVTVDATGHAYATGYTNSANFPVTTGAYQSGARGGQDAFVTKLNTDGKSLLYSTHIGGSSDDAGYAVAVDATGHAYVAGFTYSSDFPTTAGVAQSKFAGGSSDVFVTKLSADGAKLAYSTYLGGAGDDNANAVALDRAGRAYVGGFTSSMNFPVTASAYQGTFNGGPFDAFVASLSADGKSIVYATYLGGSAADYINSVAADSHGNVYAAGITYSTNFPTTPGSVQPSPRVVQDAFITKLNIAETASVPARAATRHVSQ